MHIITGLFLAALFGKKGKKRQPGLSGLPRLESDPVQVVHALPGRIRVRVHALRGNTETKKLLLQLTPRLDGITSVEVNEITGSIVVTYNEKIVRPDFIFAALVRFLGLEKELDKPPYPILKRELSDFSSSLNRAVYEKSGGFIDLWSGLLIILAVLGTRRFLSKSGNFWPAGFTLLWWALNGLTKDRTT